MAPHLRQDRYLHNNNNNNSNNTNNTKTEADADTTCTLNTGNFNQQYATNTNTSSKADSVSVATPTAATFEANNNTIQMQVPPLAPQPQSQHQHHLQSQSHLINHLDLSPTSAALSTAAAVAAIGSCFAPVNGPQTNTIDAAVEASADLSWLNKSTPTSTSLSTNAATTTTTTNSTINSTAIAQQQQQHPQSLQQQQQQMTSARRTTNSNSANTSHSITPCPTPGPLAPPPSRLLPQNHSVFNHHQNQNFSNKNNNINTKTTNNNGTVMSVMPMPIYHQPHHPGAPVPMPIPTANNTSPHTRNAHTPPSYFHPSGPLPYNNIHSNLATDPAPNAPPVYHPSQMSPPINNPPSIFANAPLRRGKWTAEEEQFANALIEEFEKGTIIDCENGCTLRAYLSRKLHCAPMRISKKYAGKSIGKHVFLSRIGPLTSNNGNGLHIHGDGLSIDRNGGINTNNHNNMIPSLDKLRNLEFRFHMNLLQEGTACAMRHDIRRNYSSMESNGIATAMSQPTLANGSFPMIFPTPTANYSTPTINNNTTQSPTVTNTTRTNTPTITNVPGTTFQWFASGTNSETATSSNLEKSNSQSLPTVMQMQQTLLNAYKEAQITSPPSTLINMESEHQHSQQQHHHNQEQQQSFTFEHPPTRTNADFGVKVIPQMDGKRSNMTTVNHVAIKTGNQSNNAGLSDLFSQFTATTGNSKDNDIKVEDETDNNPHRTSTSQAQQNWLAETMNIIPTLDPSQYMGEFSPTYTSKSFDDLHQFIGNDCPPTAVTAASTTSAENDDINKCDNNIKSIKDEIKGPATDAANSIQCHNTMMMMKGNSFADAYSLFAQQSATAVSMHAAYASPSPFYQMNDGDIRGKQNQQQQQHGQPHGQGLNVHNSTQTGISNEIPLLAAPSSNTQILQNNNIVEGHEPTILSTPINNGTNSLDSSSLTKNMRKSGDELSAPSALFNATNLQLHSESECISSNTLSSHNTSNLTVPIATRDKPSSKFDAAVLRHSNVVSGSDRSSSVSGGGSGSSGSDNASDNSDSASDEGQGSSSKSSSKGLEKGPTGKRCNSNGNVNCDLEQNNTKRQKISCKKG